jgi:hypothetical protein
MRIDLKYPACNLFSVILIKEIRTAGYEAIGLFAEAMMGAGSGCCTPAILEQQTETG